MGQETGSTHPNQHDDTSPPGRAVGADTRRRRFLITAAATTGVVGAGMALWPFIDSMRPSARAKAVGGPVSLDLAFIEPGAQTTVTWRGQPVWVLRRTPQMLERMTHAHWLDQLRDPDSLVDTQQPAYVQNATRSLRPDVFVAVALCTHLGCVPSYHPDAASDGLGEDWMGGYFCPCHGSKFDLAGRVTKNVPAPTNLVVPPHRYVDGDTLQIGVDHV